MNKAYMIRNDGEVFEVTAHIYFTEGLNDVFDGDGLNWLYSHTNRESTKKLVEDLIIRLIEESLDLTYLDDNFDVESNVSFDSYLYEKVRETFDVYLPYELDDIILSAVKSAEASEWIRDSVIDISDICYELEQCLNNEFLRARIGGKYDYDDFSNSIAYFRVSSHGFDWFPIIYFFVYDRRHYIDFVTIVTDRESTGKEKVYKINGFDMNNFPTNDFIKLSGNPIIEQYTSL